MTNEELIALRRKALTYIQDRDDNTPIAMELENNTFVDPDCYGLFEENESGNIYQLIVDAQGKNLCMVLGQLPKVVSVLSDSIINTLQGIGEMHQAIFCEHCGEMLNEEYEYEPQEPIIQE